MRKKEKQKPPPTQKELRKAKESLDYWLARIQARAMIDLLRGKKDV